MKIETISLEARDLSRCSPFSAWDCQYAMNVLGSAERARVAIDWCARRAVALGDLVSFLGTLPDSALEKLRGTP